MNDHVIITERLGLRRWKDEDIIPFAAMNNDAEVMRYFPSTLSYDETIGMVKRIRSHFDKHGFGLFAIDELSTKTFIGYTGFMMPSFTSYFTPCIEIGWRLQRPSWNKGYATEAAKACLHYGFETLSFDTIFSFTSVLNTRSINVMERIGMKKNGEFNHPNIEASHSLCRHVLYVTEKLKLV
jgi:RimJ/RimL family protein N-acetyltransferase